MNDWTGNGNSVFKTLGSSSHTDKEREQHDYYATDPKAAKLLLELETFKNVLEPACGEGHLSKVLIEAGITVTSSDLINRGFGSQKNFFDYKEFNGDIITNPPYKYGLEFVQHALKIIPNGNKVAMFLKLQFLEGKKRKKFFQLVPLKTLYVSSSRILCAKNGKFASVINGKKIAVKGIMTSSAVAYGWFVWQKGYSGDTIIKWFN